MEIELNEHCYFKSTLDYVNSTLYYTGKPQAGRLIHFYTTMLWYLGGPIYKFGIQEAKTAFNNFLFYKMEP